MAAFPISANFYGDFVLKLVVVDTTNTMAEVAQAVTENVIGVHVLEREGEVIRARKPGEPDPLPLDLTVADAGLLPTETLEFYYESAS